MLINKVKSALAQVQEDLNQLCEELRETYGTTPYYEACWTDFSMRRFDVSLKMKKSGVSLRVFDDCPIETYSQSELREILAYIPEMGAEMKNAIEKAFTG